jgi:hypothetical protein
MRTRARIWAATALATSIIGGVEWAAAFEPIQLTQVFDPSRLTQLGPSSRLGQLSTRQQLRDRVCIAKADGQISRWERARLLADAKGILKPEEYLAFKESLDRLTPPQSTGAKYSMKYIGKTASGAAIWEKVPTNELTKPPVPQASTTSRPQKKLTRTDAIVTGQVVSTVDVR